MNPNALQYLSPALASQLNLTQGPQGNPQQTDSGLLNFLLPTGGAVLGDVIGGPLGGGLGAAGGQALSDILSGKPLGGDVALQGGLGAAGGLLGPLLGKLGGGILSGAGEDLATGGLNLTKSQLAKYAAEHGESVAQTLTDAGMAGVNADSLDTNIGKLGQMYSTAANQDVPVDPNTFLNNSAQAINDLRSQVPGSSKKMADALQKEIEDNVLPGIPDSPTMADINKLKGQYDANTTSQQFNADPQQWGVNRIVGNIFRSTLNDSADANGVVAENGQSLSQLGQRLNKLYDLSDVAQKRVGVGGSSSLFSIGNEAGAGLGMEAAHLLGGNPLVGGAIIPGINLASKAVRSTPAIAGPLSQLLSRAGGAISGAAGPSGIAGAGLGGALGGLLQPSQGVVSTSQGNQNNQENQSNQTTQSVTPSNSGDQVAPNGVQIDPQGHYVLPDLNSVQTTIPGQVYPPESQAADLQKVSKLPFYMQDAAVNQIRAKAELNTQIVNQYMSTHALAPDQVQMMQNLPSANDQLNSLRDLVKSESGKNLFQAVLNDNPIIQTIKAAQDPQYAQMLSLMRTTRATAEYAQVHGRLSNFDIQNLSNTPGPGDTVQSALAKLDLQQSTMADIYARYLPSYGYSLVQGNSQSTAGGAPATTPAEPTVSGVPVSLFNLLGISQQGGGQ